MLQTCYDLLEGGYNVFLCVDAVSSRSPVDRKVAIQQLQRDGVVLTTPAKEVVVVEKEHKVKGDGRYDV